MENAGTTLWDIFGGANVEVNMYLHVAIDRHLPCCPGALMPMLM